MLSRAVASPPPPDAYRKIATGPATEIALDPAQAVPISGSDSLLRGLSPFVIQIELPLVFGMDGGFTNQAQNSVNINAYGNANGQADLYANARSSVAASGIAAWNGGVLGIPADPNPTVGQTNPAPGGTNVSNTGEGSNRLGAPAIADQYAAMDVASQLQAILNAPPLVLLINPHQFQMTLSKIQSYQDRTRFGYIFHTWGEEQPKLSITTKCGAFISGGRGVQFASKNDSAAWQNLMNLLHFYKNNGYIFDTIGKSYAHHFVGALSITYDGWIYYGHMESFGWNYEETTQNGGIDFAIEFTVSSAIDTTPATYAITPMTSPVPSPSDPRYFGAASVGSDGPGVYTIGKDGITSVGRDVGWSGVNTLVPDDLGKVFTRGEFQQADPTAIGQTSASMGAEGFYFVTELAEKTIQQGSPGSNEPFGLG